MASSVTYLGYQINKDGFHAMAGKVKAVSRHQPRQREYGSNFHLQASLLQWEGARSPSLPKEEQLSQAHSILFNYINLLFQCINTIYHPIATHAQSLSHPMTLSPIYLVHYYLICTFPMSLLYTLQPIPALYSDSSLSSP